MRKMLKIAIVNQKGGVGKTCTASFLAFALAAKSKKVLAVDLDSSKNLTRMMYPEEPNYTLLNAFDEDCTTEEAVCHIRKNLDILCGDLGFAQAAWIKRFKIKDEETGEEFPDPTVLADELRRVEDKYDYCVIDSPPSLGIMMSNTLTAADEIVIPCDPDVGAIYGIQDLNGFIEQAKVNNSKLKIAGILMTRCKNTNQTRAVTDLAVRIADAIGTKVFRAKIRDNTDVAEARNSSEFLREYDPKCIGTQDYNTFVNGYWKDLNKR